MRAYYSSSKYILSECKAWLRLYRGCWGHYYESTAESVGKKFSFRKASKYYGSNSRDIIMFFLVRSVCICHHRIKLEYAIGRGNSLCCSRFCYLTEYMLHRFKFLVEWHFFPNKKHSCHSAALISGWSGCLDFKILIPHGNFGHVYVSLLLPS